MNRRLVTILWLLFLGIGCTYAQTFLYDVDFVFDFDNRESHSAYEDSGTLFGIRLTPTIGVGYEDSIVGSHRLMAGVSYIQPFGATWRNAKVTPTIYYRFAKSGFSASLGFVPYTMMLDRLPEYMMSDSMRFVYPNIQGALFQYQDHRGELEALIDWRGMMTDTVREAFRVIGTGRGYAYRDANHAAYLGGRAMLNHLSHSEKVLGVCDDITLQPMVGYRYESGAQRVRQWSARAEVGYLMSWQRDRRADYSQVSHGVTAEAELRWWFVGVRETLYAGGNAMSLYPKYGPLLNQGSANYQAGLYSRTDIYVTLAQWRFMTLYAGWGILYTKGYPISQVQQVTARFNLEELMLFTKK